MSVSFSSKITGFGISKTPSNVATPQRLRRRNGNENRRGILDYGRLDAVVVLEAPDDETMSAFILKVGSLGNVKGQTLRAFRRNEMEGILTKIK